MGKINNPHDTLFQLMMSRPKAAKDFFNLHLPEHIKDLIDWDSLQQEAQVYTDGTDKKIIDVLYSTKIAGQEGYLLLLTEHQSTPQRLMPLRLVEYILRIVRSWLDRYGKHAKLPTVYPVIFYTGTRKYRHSTDFWGLFQDPERMKAILMSPFQLVELIEVSDEALRAHQESGLTEFLMKHRKETDIVKSLSTVPELFKSASQDMAYFKTLMCYTLEQADSKYIANLIHLFTEVVDAEAKEDMMTIAERLRQEGRQEGRQKGIQEGIEQGIEQGIQKGMQQGKLEAKKEVAFGLLKRGYAFDLITELTALTQEDLAILAKEIVH